MARQGRVWKQWERSLVKAFGAVLSQGATLAVRERSLLSQRRLDELVGYVAERLMSTSSRTREVITWTMRTIAECLGVHMAVLRRHDYFGDVSVIEAHWTVPPLDGRIVPAEVAFVDELATEVEPTAYFGSGEHCPAGSLSQ